jgi:hypothetical protein
VEALEGAFSFTSLAMAFALLNRGQSPQQYGSVFPSSIRSSGYKVKEAIDVFSWI